MPMKLLITTLHLSRKLNLKITVEAEAEVPVPVPVPAIGGVDSLNGLLGINRVNLNRPK